MPLRHIDDDLFVRAFVLEIGCQLLSQQPGMCSHNAVFAGVITRMAMKYVDANLLLRRLSRNFPNCTFRYVKQKLLQSQGSFEVRTCCYSAQPISTAGPVVTHQLDFMVFHHSRIALSQYTRPFDVSNHRKKRCAS